MNDEGRANDQVVMVGAASKGIIQRDFQHNAMVYKSAYSKNPFEGVTDKEIEEYKQYVAKKQRGEPGKFFFLFSFISSHSSIHSCWFSWSMIIPLNRVSFLCPSIDWYHQSTNYQSI